MIPTRDANDRGGLFTLNFSLAAGAIIEIGTGLGTLTLPKQLVILLLNKPVTGSGRYS
jgi:hypothetical protein